MNYTERNKLLDKISVIVLMAIIIEVFLYVVDLVYTQYMADWLLKVPGIINGIGIVFLVISVVLYILAYKKSSSSKAICATEVLVWAFLCPFLNYWYLHSKAPLNQVSKKVLWIIVLVYYVVRIICAWVYAYMHSSAKQLKKKKNK